MSRTDALIEQAKRAYAANNFTVCEALCQSALKESPNEPAADLLLAFCNVRTGCTDLAISRFLRVIEREPNLVEAHLGLSSAYFQSARFQEAVHHGLLAADLDPGDTGTLLHLARRLMGAKRPWEALTVWKSLVSRDPHRPEFLQGLALCLASTGAKDEARRVRWRLVELFPERVEEWINLGKICLSESASAEALDCALKALSLSPNRIDAHTLAAMALSEMGEAVQAEAHLRISVAANPNDAIAVAALGLALQEQGKFEEARAPLEKSIDLWPGNGLAYYTLVRSKKITSADGPFIRRLEEASELPGLDGLHASYIQYAQGKANEDLGEYATAIRKFDEANRLAYDYWLAHRPWNREKYSRTFDLTIQTFDTARIGELQPSSRVSEKPLFVIGMIRSGTTLVEQILSSHPQIAAAGEQTFWHEHAGRAFDPETGAVDTRQLAGVAQEYLSLLENVSATASRVTDKLPHNYALVGIIAAAIPGARFIHVRRHPVDNCVSIYTTAYQRPPAFTLNRDNIVFAYREYLRMMEHWRRTIASESLLEISYEDLVGDREEVARRMISFAGVEWSDACLLHEANTRSVHTPSAWQVRQPIYKTSIERWRRFEPWIAPFDALLPG